VSLGLGLVAAAAALPLSLSERPCLRKIYGGGLACIFQNIDSKGLINEIMMTVYKNRDI